MTTHQSIQTAAGNAIEELRDILALGTALRADRLQEAVLALRLSISALEGLSVQLEGQERDPRLLIGVEPSALGGWWSK